MSEVRAQALDYPNIDIFYNAASTNAQATLALVQKRFDRWDGAPHVEYHKTSANVDDFREILTTAIEKKDGQTITGAISGDGAINNIMQIKQSPDTPKIVKDSPLWTPGGGNAVNLFRALTRRIYENHPEETIKHGQIDEFYPISIKSYDSLGQKEERLAATIFSVGAMALAANNLNLSDHRNSRIRSLRAGEIIADPIQVLKSLKLAQEFNIFDRQKGFRSIYDNIFINSSWNAKIMYARNVSLTGPAYNFEVRRKKTQEIVMTIAKLAVGKANGDYLDNQQSFSVLSDNVMAQVDGEAWPVKAGTFFDIGYASQPIKVVTTLKNP
jgi:hypothetical protein